MDQPVTVQGLTPRSVIRVAFTEWGQAHKHASEVREAPGGRTHWVPHTKVLGPTLGALETALKLAGEEDSVTVWAPPGPSELEGGEGGKAWRRAAEVTLSLRPLGQVQAAARLFLLGGSSSMSLTLHPSASPGRSGPFPPPQDPYPHRPHHTSRDLTRPQ